MVKQKAIDVKREIKKQEEEFGDDHDDLEKDDDVEKMDADVFGRKPKRGENFADQVRQAGETRRGKNTAK